MTSGLFLAIIARLVVFAFALISGVFMIGVLFSFAVWVLTGQHAAFLSMLDFLAWGALSFVPMMYRISAVKKPDTRARKIASYIAMLERGETIHG